MLDTIVCPYIIAGQRREFIMAYATKAKQSWNQGDVVSVGFVKGLEVVAKVATPGDYRPDLYALWQPSTGRFYSFVPHNGLTRCASLEEAMSW